MLKACKEALWEEFSIINNGVYTGKVRDISAHLGLEPRYYNYNKENPVSQVCFSHVQRQLVVVALEEHQSSSHLTPTGSVINRTIYVKSCSLS